MRRLFGNAVAVLLPCVVVLTVACGLAYLEVQQNLRTSANDPQIQLAEDAAARLDAGASPADVVPTGRVDLASSLAPFVAVDDVAGHTLVTNGALFRGPPAPPSGVLDEARITGRDVVTWEPNAGLRFALVAVAWQGGTVLAGRSLRVVEQREDNALLIAIAAGAVGLVALGAASLLGARLLVKCRSRGPSGWSLAPWLNSPD